MVTDPPEDGEPEGSTTDGSADEDPIEEVDFWEEVGEERPAEPDDLTGGADPDAADAADPSPGPGEARPDEDPLPDREEARWPDLDDEADAGGATGASQGRSGPADDAGGERPSSEIDTEERLSGDAGPRGLDLGLGPDRDEGDEPDAGEPGDPTPEPEAAPTEGPDEDRREPTEDHDPPTDPSDDGADGEGTEVVTEPELGTDVDPEIPRLRERGPVEAGPEPREGVPEADGPCHLCGEQGEEDARYACVSCEEPACSSHMWIMFGLCEGCATEEQIRKLRGERTHDDWSAFLEIKWVT